MGMAMTNPSLYCLTTSYFSRYAVTLRLAFLLSNPTTPKDLAPLKAVDTSNERLTPKLEIAVWRLMVNFNTPLATPTCHVKTALRTLQDMKVKDLTSLLVLSLTVATCE
jgi:hypothetical protein